MLNIYLPSLGAFLGELGKVDILIWMLFTMLLAAHLHKKSVVGHASLWFFSF